MKVTRKPYQVLDLVQGSDEWKQERFNYVTASQVAALVGLCPYQTREDLLKEKLTKIEREVNSYKQVLFEQAHKAEKKCREWVEKEYGMKFDPAVLISSTCPDLLASLDGFNDKYKLTFEAKYMGKTALEEVKQGIIKAHHMIQVQSQLFVSGAETCIYFALDQEGEAAVHEIKKDKFYHKFIPLIVNKFMNDVRERAQ